MRKLRKSKTGTVFLQTVNIRGVGFTETEPGILDPEFDKTDDVELEVKETYSHGIALDTSKSW